MEIARGAIDSGISSDRVYAFSAQDDRGKIKNAIALKTADKDIILYKASRGIRLEELL